MDGERRQNWTCSAHGELVEALHDINLKLDGMIVRQIEYAERSVRIEQKQENLEKIVTNGLSHNVAAIAERLDTFCKEVKKRLDLLEEFQWFRLPVTKLRDSIFWLVCKVAVVGGLLYLVIHYGGDIIKAALR
jgi:hypothetical protein